MWSSTGLVEVKILDVQIFACSEFGILVVLAISVFLVGSFVDEFCVLRWLCLGNLLFLWSSMSYAASSPCQFLENTLDGKIQGKDEWMIVLVICVLCFAESLWERWRACHSSRRGTWFPQERKSRLSEFQIQRGHYFFHHFISALRFYLTLAIRILSTFATCIQSTIDFNCTLLLWYIHSFCLHERRIYCLVGDQL